jgi:hypothetical protein
MRAAGAGDHRDRIDRRAGRHRAAVSVPAPAVQAVIAGAAVERVVAVAPASAYRCRCRRRDCHCPSPPVERVVAGFRR